MRQVPKLVIDYNSGMGSVDQSDQRTDHYAGEFRTVKLWRKVVLHLIDRTVTEVYVLQIKQKSPIEKAKL